jgi:hypothetical protein
MNARVVIVAALVCAAVLSAPARADAPAAATTARTANPFTGAGVFIDDIGNLPGPVGLAETLERDGFTWIAFHAHNGILESYPQNAEWFQVMRAHGLRVGLWGWEDAHPWLAAQLAVFEVRMTGADFYIADAEFDYLRAAHSPGWYRSRTFAQTFRQFEPTLPAAVTTFGAAVSPWILPLDYAAWRAQGFDLLPQAYYNQFPKVDRPESTVAHALRAKWPLDRVHPVIGVYRKYPAANYVPMLRAAGTTGYSVFLADQATSADYDALSVLNSG